MVVMGRFFVPAHDGEFLGCGRRGRRPELVLTAGAKVGQMSGGVVLSRGGVKPGHWLG